MKKLILLVVLAAGMAFAAKAQENGFGVRVGLNLSKLNGDFKDNYDGADIKMKPGFNIGIIYDYGFSENFYLQPGLYYTLKGVKAEYKDEGENDKYTYNLSYLELPILASYRISLSDNTKWHINVGPYLAVGIGGKLKNEWSYDDESGNEKYDAFGKSDEEKEEYKGNLKRFDFGLSFGTGVSFNKFYVGLKYELGLSNIGEKDYWKKENGSDAKIKNSNFAISVGYNF